MYKINLEFSDLHKLTESLKLESELDWSDELRQAGKMIRDSIVKRLENATLLRGGNMPWLRKDTKNKKEFHGSSTPSTILRASGQLLRDIKNMKIKVSSDGQSVSFGLPSTHEAWGSSEPPYYKTLDYPQLLYYIEEGQRKRPFFGIARHVEEEILKFFRKRHQERVGKKKMMVGIKK